MLSPRVQYVEAALAGLKGYDFRTEGSGPRFVEGAIRCLLSDKLRIPAPFPPGAWDGWLVLTLKAKLYSVLDRQDVATLRPTSLADIAPMLERSTTPDALELVGQYRNMLRDGEDLGAPLYITGEALSQVGANPFIATSTSMWMLDGSKRILAHCLNHSDEITIKLIVTEGQYKRLLREDDRGSLVSRIDRLAWFSNYQSIDAVGLNGQRTLARYQLMDTTLLRGKRVIDFGCNLGQACLKAAQAGAEEVIGLDVMPDTLSAARAIHALCPFPNLSYYQVDFNDPDFPAQVDAIADQVDYSFFLSVYRTLELTDREGLLAYILKKSRLGVFFEGHGEPHIDTLEFYANLFTRFGVHGQLLGYSEEGRRPLFFIDRSGRANHRVVMPQTTPAPKEFMVLQLTGIRAR